MAEQKKRTIEWYDNRIGRYYDRKYGPLEENHTFVWYTNEPSANWRFDIKELNLRVRISCDLNGKITVVEKQIRKRRVKK